jgi:hypothetical protein
MEQQLLLHPYMFSRQLLDNIKENTHQALLLGNSIQLLPIRILQGRRYILAEPMQNLRKSEVVST